MVVVIGLFIALVLIVILLGSNLDTALHTLGWIGAAGAIGFIAFLWNAFHTVPHH